MPSTMQKILLLALAFGVVSCATGRNNFEKSYQAMVSAENKAIRDSTPPMTNDVGSVIKFNVISLVGERTEKEAYNLDLSYRQLIAELSSKPESRSREGDLAPCSSIRYIVEGLTRKYGAVVPFPILTPTSRSFPWEACFPTEDYKNFTTENNLLKTNAARYLWDIED